MIAPKHLRRTGTVVMVTGVIAAVAIYVAQSFSSDREGAYSPTKRDLYEIEKMGGKATVLGVEFNSWFGGLWHGRRLAYTVGFLSVAGYVACLWLADFFTDPPPPDGGS